MKRPFRRAALPIAALALSLVAVATSNGCNDPPLNCDSCPTGQYCLITSSCGEDGLTPCSGSMDCTPIPATCSSATTCECLLASFAEQQADSDSAVVVGQNSFDCYSGSQQTFFTIVADGAYCAPGKC